MYRAVGLLAIESGAAPDDAAAVTALAERLQIHFVDTADGTRVLVNGRDVTERIRAEDVTSAASVVSTITRVRELMVTQQREIGSSHRNVVMEGRDIGTVVFPQADVKIYLDAAADVRTARRLKDADVAGASSESMVRKRIDDRDQRDRTRQVSPLMAAADAICLDSSTLTAEEVLEKVWAIVKTKMSK